MVTLTLTLTLTLTPTTEAGHQGRGGAQGLRGLDVLEQRGLGEARVDRREGGQGHGQVYEAPAAATQQVTSIHAGTRGLCFLTILVVRRVLNLFCIMYANYNVVYMPIHTYAVMYVLVYEDHRRL